MVFTVDVAEIASRFPRPLTAEETDRIKVLILDAVSLIEVAFAKAGRDFKAELGTVAWLDAAARVVVREMVSAAIAVGANAGIRSASSTTGPQADSVTWADGIDFVSFGGVKLTDSQKLALGLVVGSVPRGSFPPPIRYPERRAR